MCPSGNGSLRGLGRLS
ncbi:hypothetical protein STRIP9103_03123, partial [Streptomyces ipomoeae 91-03]